MGTVSKPKVRPKRRPNPKAALYRAGHLLKLADYEAWRVFFSERREVRYGIR